MPALFYEGWMILAALLPSVGLLYLFYVVMKHMVEGDRRERAALREADRAEAQGRPQDPQSGVEEKPGEPSR